MPKSKAPPKDYDADMRIEPYPAEDMTKKEQWERFERGVTRVLSGGARRREPDTASETE